MLKLKLHRDTGPLVILGLSEMNIQRMKDGQPINFPLEQIGLGDGEIVIMAGQTEADMAKQLEDAGLLPPGMASDIEKKINEAERKS